MPSYRRSIFQCFCQMNSYWYNHISLYCKMGKKKCSQPRKTFFLLRPVLYMAGASYLTGFTFCPMHSSPKEVHIDFIQFSWWPRVTDIDPGSYQVCQMVLEKHAKDPVWEFLSRPFDKIKMTRGWGRWPRDFRKEYVSVSINICPW